jgi:hypothetical protein
MLEDNLQRPVLQASRPSQTMATMGPLNMSGDISTCSGCIGSTLTGDKALEERLVGEIGVVLLEVVLGGGDHLQGDELVATLLKALDDVANKATLGMSELLSIR